MPTTLNRTTYLKLVEEDVQWLKERTPPSPERAHVIAILEAELDTPFHYEHSILKPRLHRHDGSLCEPCRSLPNFQTPPTFSECQKCVDGNWQDRTFTKKAPKPPTSVKP